MLSGERDREANSFGVEASLPKDTAVSRIPRFARNDSPGYECFIDHHFSGRGLTPLSLLRNAAVSPAAVLPVLLARLSGNNQQPPTPPADVDIAIGTQANVADWRGYTRTRDFCI